MAVITMKPYGKLALALANKEADLNSDSLIVTLHTASYTPNLDTHGYVSDLTNELAAGSGYTQGSKALGSPTIAYTAANSWGQTAATSTAYAVGDVRRPSTGNGYLYRCTVAGTSGGSAPTWGSVVGGTTTDGTVTWTNVGRGAVAFSGLAVQWTSFSAGPFRYIVLSDRTPGTDATRPLIAIGDFGSDQTGGGGNFDVTWDAGGILLMFAMV